MIVYLYFWENISQAKIAKILGLSQVRINRILASSLKKMKSILLTDQPRTEIVPKPDFIVILTDTDKSTITEEGKPMKSMVNDQETGHDQKELYLTRNELLLAFLLAQELAGNEDGEFKEIRVYALAGHKLKSPWQYLSTLCKKGVLEQPSSKAEHSNFYRLGKTRFLAWFTRGDATMILPSGKIINHNTIYDLLDLVSPDGGKAKTEVEIQPSVSKDQAIPAMPPQAPPPADEPKTPDKTNSEVDVLARLHNRKLQLEQELQSCQKRLTEIPELIKKIEISLTTIKSL